MIQELQTIARCSVSGEYAGKQKFLSIKHFIGRVVAIQGS